MSDDGTEDRTDTTEKRTRMRGEERREFILAHARKVFAQRGYLDASTGELARACEITEPMLYKHFGSKKGLFQEVMKQCSANFMQTWETQLERRARHDILDALSCVLLDYNNAIAVDPDTQRVLFHAVAQAGDAEIANKLRKHNERIRNVIHSLLEQAQAQGKLARDIDIDAAGWGYVSMFLAMQYSVVLDFRGELDKGTIEKINHLWLCAVTGKNVS